MNRAVLLIAVHSLLACSSLLADSQSQSNGQTVKNTDDQTAVIARNTDILVGDAIRTTLEIRDNGKWTQVGSVVERKILEGAPFTFGRALGLGAEDLKHGSQIYLDGVAVFDRVLEPQELRMLAFDASSDD